MNSAHCGQVNQLNACLYHNYKIIYIHIYYLFIYFSYQQNLISKRFNNIQHNLTFEANTKRFGNIKSRHKSGNTFKQQLKSLVCVCFTLQDVGRTHVNLGDYHKHGHVESQC